MVLGMVLGFGFNKTKVLAAAEKCVQQGKLQNAITEYDKIVKQDPRDLTVLNTIGDLYARLGNVDQATTYFKRVGDAYATNGFTVKAIAMYKKLTKLSPGSLDCIQKLGELYTQQGLYNDARAQLIQVADHHMRHGNLEQASNIFHKLLELDPENSAMQTKMAELYVKIGKKDEARNIYFRAAESLHQRGALKQAEEALQRVLDLDPQNTRALSLAGQIALDTGNTEKALALLERVPDIDSRPDALQYLLRAYLQGGRTADAEPIARKLFSVHNDLGGIVSCAEALVAAGLTQPAITLFEDYADRLLANDSNRLVQALSSAVGRVKEDATQLEILRKLFIKAGDETHSAEVAELLAHASVQSGDLAKARDLYQELAALEPDNPLHLQNYKQILARLGEESTTRELSAEEGAQAFLVDEIEPVEAVVEQNYPEAVAAAIQTALTESELFDSYNVPNKAIPPLQAVLPRAPYDLRLNQRLASLYARTGRYSDAARACSVLQEVYASSGHASEADQYRDMAAKYAHKAGVAVPEVEHVRPEEISPAQPAPIVPAFEVSIPEPASFESAVAPASSPELPTVPVVGSGTAHEIDLSDEWEHVIADEVAEAVIPDLATSVGTTAQPIGDEPESTVDETSEIVQEIRFYIAQSMWNEAGAALVRLAVQSPDHPELPALRNAHAAGAIVAGAQEPAIELAEPIDAQTTAETATQEQAALAAFVDAAPADTPVPGELEVVTPAAPFEVEPVGAPPYAEEQPAIAASASAPAGDTLADFVFDLEESLGDDFALGAPPASSAAPPPVAAPVPPPQPVHAIAARVEVASQPHVEAPAIAIAAAAAATSSGEVSIGLDEASNSTLSDLFAEFKEELEEKTDQGEDPDTHYNLGVAFKEMGLLDEAIGELQKVCHAVDRGVPFSQTMQAYTWLAHCFVEKGVPEAAFKWYEKALKLPCDEDTGTAIHYELACAYEVANRRQEALNHFMEVYTTNIDFRDVAERIKALKS